MPLWLKGEKREFTIRTDCRLASKPQECLSERRNSLDIFKCGKNERKDSLNLKNMFRCQKEIK